MTIRCLTCHAVYKKTDAGTISRSMQQRLALQTAAYRHAVTPCPRCYSLYAENVLAEGDSA